MLRDRLVPQLCLLFCSCGMPVLLACPRGDVILAQAAFPLNDVIFCLHQEQITYLSTNSAAALINQAENTKHKLPLRAGYCRNPSSWYLLHCICNFTVYFLPNMCVNKTLQKGLFCNLFHNIIFLENCHSQKQSWVEYFENFLRKSK